MYSIIRVGERLHKVLGQIDLAHLTQVSDRPIQGGGSFVLHLFLCSYVASCCRLIFVDPRHDNVDFGVLRPGKTQSDLPMLAKILEF